MINQDYEKLERLVKQHKGLKTRYIKLYKERNDKFDYTFWLKAGHKDIQLRKDWEKKNNFLQIEDKLYDVESEIKNLRRELYYTSKISYVKLGKTQKDLIAFLRDNPDIWFSIKQLSNKLKSNDATIRNSLKTPLKRRFIIFKKVGKKNSYKISKSGKTFHKDNRPLNIGDGVLLDFIRKNKGIGLNKLKKSYAYKEKSFNTLKHQKLIYLRDNLVGLSKKGEIYSQALEI